MQYAVDHVVGHIDKGKIDNVKSIGSGTPPKQTHLICYGIH